MLNAITPLWEGTRPCFITSRNDDGTVNAVALLDWAKDGHLIKPNGPMIGVQNAPVITDSVAPLDTCIVLTQDVDPVRLLGSPELVEKTRADEAQVRQAGRIDAVARALASHPEGEPFPFPPDMDQAVIVEAAKGYLAERDARMKEVADAAQKVAETMPGSAPMIEAAVNAALEGAPGAPQLQLVKPPEEAAVEPKALEAAEQPVG